MSEKIKPVAYLYKIRGGVRHQTIEFSSLTDDDTCWQNRDDGKYELLSVSPLYSAETVQQLQQRNDRLFAALKNLITTLAVEKNIAVMISHGAVHLMTRKPSSQNRRSSHE